MTTRKNVGKNDTRITLSIIQQSLPSSYEIEMVAMYEAGRQAYTTERGVRQYQKLAAKAERLDAERKGIRGRFVPKAERDNGGKPVIERLVEKEPRVVEAKVRFSGRNKLAVPGYGPAYRTSK